MKLIKDLKRKKPRKKNGPNPPKSKQVIARRSARMSAPPQPSVQNIRRSGRITPGNNSADRANDQPPTVSTNTKNSAPVQTLSYVAASSSFEPERASPSSSTMELKPDKDKIQNTSNSSTSAILVLCFSNKFIGILWCMFNLSLQSAI